jgi:formate hydrogenlyase transcriptional activator
LIAVVQLCAEEVELPGLARSVGRVLVDLPGLCAAGVAVFDEERRAVQRYTAVFSPSSGFASQEEEASIREEEFPVEETEIPALLDGHGVSVVDLRHEHATSLGDRLRAGGCRRYLSVPIKLQDRLLGALFVASSGTEKIPDPVVAIAKDLARAVTPVLYNCLNHVRFARGDRRRDALIELANVINSSLELGTVLSHAGRILGSLEGHQMSAICLLNDGNRTYRSHQIFRPAGSGRVSMPEPTVHRVKDSVVAWLLKHGSTYESEDLEGACHYEEERELRKHGVRRYLAIPLLARGRILGGFMFGTQDPHPRRKVEYWLYENIAMQLALAVDNAVKHEQLQRLTDQLANQNAYLRKEIQTEQGFGEMIGRAPAMEALRADILRVAATDATVLITGETGVGKELVARSIHEHSGRSGQPFIKVNCPSIPEGMVESELFGHERGAFTSAVERRIGRFELAHDGTLFLDEIGELSPALQAKLLRVLQDGEFERVGGSKTLSTNARIIAATNRNLEKAIEDSKFRADLYFRINVFPIYVPPLRTRREDIPALVEAFISEFSQRLGKRLDSIAEHSLADLCRRDWPGNIRELRHTIERAAILSKGSCLAVEEKASQGVPGPAELTIPSRPGLLSLDAAQAEHIRRALEACGGRIEGNKGAAALLGLKPSTLRFRMKRLGIEKP